jgi:glycosyltransferase involved in cell wall biosynthesis
MKRPGLAYVVHSLSPGGTERLVVEMALAFATEFDVRVYTLDAPGAWADRLQSSGVPVTGLGRRPGVDLTVSRRLARLLRDSDARIVHAHQCSAWFYAALARYANRRPRLLLEEHGRFWPEQENTRRRWFNRLAVVPMTDRFVAVSQDIAQRLATYEGVPRARIEVVPNGVSPAEPCDAAERARRRAALGVRDDEFLVGAIGRLDPIKNLPMLLDAVGAAAREVDRLRAVLVGDGPQRAALEAGLQQAGLAGRVIVAGHRDDARALLPCFDLYALTSFSEGMSVALLEAMSAGVPAAVTAVGANAELVSDGETGWVVGSDDRAALTGVLRAAAGDRSECLRRGSAARRCFEQRYTMPAMLDAYRGIYHAMLGAVPRPAFDAARPA